MEDQTATVNESLDHSRKRRRSSDSCLAEGPAAKFLIETPPFNIQNFSDEILCEIFGLLDGNTLLTVSQSCYRFYSLIQDYRFWRKIDLSSVQLNVAEISKKLRWMGEYTKEIKLRGLTETFPATKWKSETITPHLLSLISTKATTLHTLELDSAYINMEKVSMANFPTTLKRLVFTNCNVLWPRNARSFFSDMDFHLENLEELGIERCVWFEPYDLMIFSKLKNLRWLSLRGCNNLKDFVPYGSMSTRFGFKKLEYLDIRDTPITDSDVQCFNCVHTLKEILLECPTDMRNKYKNATASSSSDNEMPSSSRSTPGRRPDSNEDSDGEVANVNNQEIEDPRRHYNRFSINPDRMFFITLDDRLRPENGQAAAAAAADQAENNIPPQRAQPVVPVVRFENIRDVLNLGLMDRPPHFHRARTYFNPPNECPISNRGISAFGRPPNPVQMGIVSIQIASRPPDTNFERLTIRDYHLVTDLALRHLVQCTPHLVFLDITGTGVTKEGVQSFKSSKPDCYIVSDYFTG